MANPLSMAVPDDRHDPPKTKIAVDARKTKLPVKGLMICRSTIQLPRVIAVRIQRRGHPCICAHVLGQSRTRTQYHSHPTQAATKITNATRSPIESPSNINDTGKPTAVTESSSNHPKTLGPSHNAPVHRHRLGHWTSSSINQLAPMTTQYQSQLNPVVRR